VVAEDVFVEILSRPHAKHETSWEQGGRSRGCLGDHSWMHPDERARHPSAYPQPFSRLGNAANDTPHKGALTLLSDPGMIMIREHGKRKAGLLCLLGIIHQGTRAMLFAGELIANFDMWSLALRPMSALVWLYGRCQATFDVLPFYNAHELSSGRGHHHACYTMLSRMLSNIPEGAVRANCCWP
jgi:hypothetical protein